MLKKLAIEQFVIIDRLDIDFKPGLTIITGDTGAGKSILLDAMGQILGEAADIKAIRQGSEQSMFEAVLTPPSNNGVWKYLFQRDLVEHSQQEFTIRRTVAKGGKDEIEVNGKKIELEELEEIGRFLVEIHGQFANQSIADPENQLTWLDAAGNFPPEYFKNVSDALDEVHRFTRELEEEKQFLADHKEQHSAIEMYVKKFESIEMYDTLVEDVQEEYETLLTARDTTEAFQAILSQFIASQGIIGMLKSTKEIFDRQENLDQEKVAHLEKYLTGALENAHSTVNEMRRLLPEYEIDTTPLHECEDTLEVLHSIANDTETELQDLFALYEELSGKLDRINAGKERVKELENLLVLAKRDYHEHAQVLTRKRIAAGKALDKAITSEFTHIKLMKAEFQVEVEEKPDNPWTHRGFNTVTYTARMNPGMPFSSIAETASGGELARMILALKVILQSVQTTPTLVFDEVDTGIGGAAAIAVGERIAHLAKNTQVLVITHSPQVASCGDQHMHVSKKADEASTTSSINFLSQDQRVDEIARMLAGDSVTEESRAAARKLMEEAKEAAANAAPSASIVIEEEPEEEHETAAYEINGADMEDGVEGDVIEEGLVDDQGDDSLDQEGDVSYDAEEAGSEDYDEYEDDDLGDDMNDEDGESLHQAF